MVRGVSRRVIVVKPEQPALFEQAIFLVRDYNAPRGDMVREACRIANSYLPRRRRSRRKADGLSLLAGFYCKQGTRHREKQPMATKAMRFDERPCFTILYTCQ